MRHILILLAGLLFGAGLALSGMTNPAKILNFLDLFGQWDPTLFFVMGGGLVTTFVGYRFVLARPAPLHAPEFVLPRTTRITRKLISGSALFGLGWGLAGFCPGPAVASLAFGYRETAIFVAAMAAGSIAARFFLARPVPQSVEG